MNITDEDIEYLLYDDNVKEFLDAVIYKQDYSCYEDYKTTKEIIINLILFLFYSNTTKKKDWIHDITFILENNMFDETKLAPSLKTVNTDNLLADIKKKVLIIKEHGAIEIDTYSVSYELFNNYLTDLYNWCKENFSTD